MPEYVRPEFPRRVFYDRDGAVIDYGRRWKGEAPPADSYGVDSNPERFAPLHSVAQALIEYLQRRYAVSVREDAAFAADLMHPRDDVLRAVRVVPLSRDEAALTFVFTAYPGVVVHAGLLHDFPFPQCGCDGCDESAETAADELEWTVLTLVAGHFAEWVDPKADLQIGYELSSPDGTRRARGATGAIVPDARLAAAAERLRELPRGWQPWTASAAGPDRG